MGSSLLILVTLLAPPAPAAPAQAAPDSKTKAAQDTKKEKPVAPAAASTTPPPVDLLPEYVIGPGDSLQLFVWKEQELTRELRVRIDGRITVPLLGDIVADGKTAMGLAAEIAAALGRFVETPTVNIIVGQATSAKIFVIGEVKNAGSLELFGRMTILQALALSGGFAQFADKNSILVIRGRQTIKVNYDKIKDGSDLAQNLVMLSGDTIVVP
jgi:polysaccharide export outer membrane protein